MEFLLCYLIVAVLSGGRAITDVIHAAKGTEPPHLAKAKLRANRTAAARPDGMPQTATLGDVLSAYWGSALADVIANRARSQQAKRAARTGDVAGPGTTPKKRDRLAGLKAFGRLIWEPVGERRDDKTTTTGPGVGPQLATQGAGPASPTPASPTPASNDRRVDPLNLNGRTNLPPGDPNHKPAPPAGTNAHDTTSQERATCGRCRWNGPWRDAADGKALAADAEGHRCPDGTKPEVDYGYPEPTEAQQRDEDEAANPEQAPDNPSTNDGGTAMTAPNNTNVMSEVMGWKGAVAYAEAVAEAHTSHGGDEGFVGSLNRMEVGADDIALVQAAQEASRNAGEMWRSAATAIRDHNQAVGEAYATSPSAANKEAQLAE